MRPEFHGATIAMLLLAACTSSPAVQQPTATPGAHEPPREGEPPPEPAMEELYVTCVMYGVSAGSASAEINERAATIFDRASTEHEAGDFGAAATGFRAAALVLLEGQHGPDAALLERSRRAAYASMVLAWLNAGAIETARAELADLAELDADVAKDLRAVAEALPKPPRCDSSPPAPAAS